MGGQRNSTPPFSQYRIQKGLLSINTKIQYNPFKTPEYPNVKQTEEKIKQLDLKEHKSYRAAAIGKEKKQIYIERIRQIGLALPGTLKDITEGPRCLPQEGAL